MNPQRPLRIEARRTFKAGFGFELGQQIAATLAWLARLAIIGGTIAATGYALHLAGWLPK